MWSLETKHIHREGNANLQRTRKIAKPKFRVKSIEIRSFERNVFFRSAMLLEVYVYIESSYRIYKNVNSQRINSLIRLKLKHRIALFVCFEESFRELWKLEVE